MVKRVGTTAPHHRGADAYDRGEIHAYPQQGSAQVRCRRCSANTSISSPRPQWAPFVALGPGPAARGDHAEALHCVSDVPTLTELGFMTLRSVQAIARRGLARSQCAASTRSRLPQGAEGPRIRLAAMKRLSMEVVDLPGPEVKKLNRERVSPRAESWSRKQNEVRGARLSDSARAGPPRCRHSPGHSRSPSAYSNT